MTIALPSKGLVARSKRRVPRRLASVVAFVAFVLVFLWWIGVLGGNVREVQAGRFYRSAQLSGSTLVRVLERYGIKSVLNLRGPSDRSYYRSETAICKSLGVAHADVSLSAYHLPQPKEIQEVLADLDRLPRPVLVHCQQGADRSGLVSALYANVYAGVPVEDAVNEQLTWRYGHFAFAGTWRMERFFELYRQTASGQSLRTWISRTYPSVYVRETAKR